MMYKVQTVGCMLYTGICSSGRARKGDPCPPAPCHAIGGVSQKYFGKKRERKKP